MDMAGAPTPTGSQPSGGFRFLELGVEIRLMIYAELLYRPDPIEFVYDSRGDYADASLCYRKTFRARHTRLVKTLYPAVIGTCKQVYNEAMPMLYESNNFKMNITSSRRPWANDFVECIKNDESRSLIKHMVVCMQKYPKP
jgi:hypothetical protein